jgi:uncharacterized spore protein YtfJ
MNDDNSDLGNRITESLKNIFGDAPPASVFSAPEKVGDDVIIMAAAWERAGGFGFGSGSGEDEETGERGGGSGGGGGGSSQGRPVAVIRVGQTGIEVQPVIDFTKIGVTFLLAAIGVWRALR